MEVEQDSLPRSVGLMPALVPQDGAPLAPQCSPLAPQCSPLAPRADQPLGDASPVPEVSVHQDAASQGESARGASGLQSASEAPPLTVLKPPTGWQLINFRELWHFRDLLYFLT